MTGTKKVLIYGTEYCAYCGAAKMLFTKKGVAYEFVSVSNDPEARREIERRSGQRTVPQIFIDDESIGGFDELNALESGGHLDALLDSALSSGSETGRH